jgi:elongation factor Ts
MSNTEMIRDLRALTQAGMRDCKEALEETGWNLQKAVDVIKAKGKLVASGSKTASEGVVGTMHFDNMIVMVEVNSVTDFVARMPEFDNFVTLCLDSIGTAIQENRPWDSKDVEPARKELMATTKENIVVRRWWAEQKYQDNSRLSSYVHMNNKIGVILHTLAPTAEMAGSKEFEDLCEDMTLQIAAMNPLAVSPDRLDKTVLDRQTAIFQAQIDAMNKPVAAHAKIMEGKLNKWYSEVCLLNQESVTTPKTTVGQLVQKLNSDIKVINFIRCQVGESTEKVASTSFSEEVEQLVMDSNT